MRLRWLAVLITLLGLGSVSAADAEPPYLYYYSSALRAFVVERADGSDSRLLGQDYIAPDARDINVLGWSLSGQWLAWTENQKVLKVLSADGLTAHKLVDDPYHVFARWSPVDDLLFVTQSPNHHVSDYDTDFALLNVNTRQIVTRFTITINESNSMTNAAWSPDGQFIGFYYQNYNEDPAVRKFESTFVLVSRDGKVTEQPGYAPFSPPNAISMGVMEWSSQGWFAEIGPVEAQTILIRNPSLDEQVEVKLPLSDDPGASSFLLWRPQGDYALIYASNPYNKIDGSTYDVWLLSIAERKIVPIAEKIYFAGYFPPTSIDPFNGIGGQDPRASWSPDGRYAVLRLSPKNDLALFDPLTGDVEPIPAQLSPDDFGRFNIAVRWSPASDALWLQSLGSRASTAIYDLESGHTSEMQGLYLGEWVFSPNGRYLSVFERRGRIYDRYADVTYGLPVHSARVYRVVAYNWHPDGEWLVSVDHLCIAGDCPAILRYGVTNPQGSYWRELGDAEVNWLPGQVDASKLSAGSPESVLLAPETIDRSVEFSYGSEDQTLQAVCDDTDETEMRIQNRESGDVLYMLYGVQPCRGSGGTVHIGVSPDGALLALGARYEDSFATLWDSKTGKLLARFNCTCFEMHFSDDGRQLFARASSAMLIWDVAKLLDHAAIP